MATSHILIENPFFGAAIYLFADILKTGFVTNTYSYPMDEKERYIYNFLMSAFLFLGLTLALFYPSYIGNNRAHFVTIFTLLIVVRDVLCAVSKKTDKARFLYWLFIFYVQFRSDLFCALILRNKCDETNYIILMSITVLTGVIKILFPEKYISTDMVKAGSSSSGRIPSFHEKVSSYRIFTNMRLYASLALSVGILMFFCNVLLTDGKVFEIRTYLNCLVWLVGILVTILLVRHLLNINSSGWGLATFIAGAITWILGAIFMFRAETYLGGMTWMAVWGVGVALIVTSLRRFYDDFNLVAGIASDENEHKSIEESNALTSTISSMISSVVMLLVMALWAFLVPENPDMESLPTILRVSMMQLPMAFMLIAIIFALNQPLDSRTREKLMLFMENNSEDERIREDLKQHLVHKYRKRFGVKIIAMMVSPFLRLRVSGVENLRKDRYPSIFVCNHGFLYGPVAAVIYLPTYFRPWIHNVMLTREGAESEIRYSFKNFLAFTGEKIGGTMIRWATAPVCWALNSFNPIPVQRGGSRGVMKTFNDSLDALQDGDNILIFPEKPSSRTKDGNRVEGVASDELRSFYTGFAHIAKMYYDKTGKSLLFYPIYSDSKARTFKIGTPVEYDSTLEPKDSKRRIANDLWEQMQVLSAK